MKYIFVLGLAVEFLLGSHACAADPHDGPKGIFDLAAARRHWSYQPVRLPAAPTVRDGDWPACPIDRYVLARLEANGLAPSPPADRRTLIRRVTFDLTGLPPTPEDSAAFENDPSPDAYHRVVERLLAAPQYGERWGRHWLDVARYADTKDLVLLFGNDRVRPFAWTYRDYVIRALNSDTPYDRFIHEQLAADQLELGDEKWRLAGLGFLTLGRLFDNNLHDIYDDQIDTVSRGFLGLTVSCARCHDHKYDAIPTADYYSLYGVFASSEQPIDLPLIAEPDGSGAALEFEKTFAQKRAELQQFIDAQYQLITETARKRVGDYLVKIATEKADPLEEAFFFVSLSPDDLKPPIISRWRKYVERSARAEDAVFGLWHDLMELPEDGFREKAREVIGRWQKIAPGTGRGQVNPLVLKVLGDAPPAGKAETAKLYGSLLLKVHDDVTGPAKTERTAEELQLAGLLRGTESPITFPKHSTYLYMSRVDRDGYGTKLLGLDKLAVATPAATARALVLNDSPEPCSPRVFVRGNPSQPGEAVPRQFLRILAGDERKPFVHGSGRLDLAEAITATDNPLTARVIVNRLWMHHFGEPLVSTPSDFGTRSTPPAQPQLLDYLAWYLQHEGWSLKKLHRHIVLSATYQQASADRPECRRADPDNRLLWRAGRRRLDFESMRDTLLYLSGRLDPLVGGRSVDLAADPLNRRRTVYGKVDRQDLPALFRAFDFAVPDSSVERRPQTTVPQQALFGMNSPFVFEQAKALAAREEVRREVDPAHRIAALYRIVLGRKPTDTENQLGQRFIKEAEEEQERTKKSLLGPWEQYVQVLLLTNELMFLD